MSYLVKLAIFTMPFSRRKESTSWPTSTLWRYDVWSKGFSSLLATKYLPQILQLCFRDRLVEHHTPFGAVLPDDLTKQLHVGCFEQNVLPDFGKRHPLE